MNKAAIDYNTVARYGAGGLMAGAGAASLVNLLHHIQQMRQERKQKLKNQDTDENTIVLTLPRKSAALVQKLAAACDSTIKHTEGPKHTVYDVNRGQKQSRAKDTGKYGPQLTAKTAGSGWPTMTGSWLAALGGGAGGVVLANEVYKKYREKQLKRELEAAKQEYMDVLTRQVKGASVIESLFQVPDQEKQAQDAFGTLSYPMAALALMTILGTGATGYLTKKVLDEKLRDTESQATDVPKVKRIVFRTARPGDGQKLAEAEEACDMADLEAVAGALLVTMDKVAGDNRFTALVVKEAELSGLTPAQLVKYAENVDELLTQLRQAPELRQSLYKVFNQYSGGKGLGADVGRFFKGMALKTPMGQNYADKKLYSTVLGLKDGGGLKIGAAPIAAMLGGGVGGALLGGDIMDSSTPPEEMAKLVAVEQQKLEEEEALKKQKVPGNVRVKAVDKGAAEYLAANKDKIQGLIRRLAAEGQL